MKVCGVTDIGCHRRDNQDSYVIRELGDGRVLLVVCDGMGGAQAGSVASSVAAEAFAAAVEQALAGAPEAEEQALAQACREANRKVYQLSRERAEYEGMGTTLVAALAGPDGCCVANVGDSRGYLLEEGAVRQVTVDHSLVQMLVDRGEITPDQARVHPRKNLITRALGVDSQVECDLGRLELRPGCRLLLCSDGLTNTMDDETLLRVSGRERSPEGFCQALLDLALERGAPDNVTVVLAQL